MMDLECLAAGLNNHDRRALAKAITLVESTLKEHRELAGKLLERVMPSTGGAFRIGISGPPGVGKSTFIDAFGTFVINRGHRLAVLAVDPSSSTSGGSILGDKTRMDALARDERAFIRPSPTGGTLGGVARKTRECLLLCEAAGFDLVVVETVGVGQSEVAVSNMTDMFVLMVSPGGGDDLQGIKRGIMERADLLIVNKADGQFESAARSTAADYANALRLLTPRLAGWEVPVCVVSALQVQGIETVWEQVQRFHVLIGESGEQSRRRGLQATQWMWDEAVEEIIYRLKHSPKTRDTIAVLEEAVRERRLPASSASRQLLEAFLDGGDKEKNQS